MMHVSDWLPTLAKVAGADTSSLGLKPLDGVDMWQALTDKAPSSPRTELLHNVDPFGYPESNAAVRQGDWKLIVGHPGQPDYWEANGEPRFPQPAAQPPCEHCTPYRSGYRMTKHLGQSVQLYNIAADPLEQYDLASTHPDVVKRLFERYMSYSVSVPRTPNDQIYEDKRGFPMFHNNCWVPWITPRPWVKRILENDRVQAALPLRRLHQSPTRHNVKADDDDPSPAPVITKTLMLGYASVLYFFFAILCPVGRTWTRGC
uniref:Sulfatase N-terminal domain-containing protein n=1 Tax=Eutreptiella gymnastica TaxID=73025 RepID=A0A7S1NFV9_9EUGL